MKELLLLRGLPASGKSTLIKELELEPYTLSRDDLRMKLGSLDQTENGYRINQKVEREVTELLNSLLEKRMKRGEFTVIDATHTTSDSCSRYKKLAEKYNYKIYYYDLGTSLEECLKRNRQRESYKKVPEVVIEGMHERFKDTLGEYFIKVTDIREYLAELKIDVLKGYESVIVIGDIHSSALPLRSVLRDFKENYKYVFIGDCFDRGLEPCKTWEILNELSKKPNVVMVLGNHEGHLLDYCNDGEVKSSSARETMAELEKNGVTKKEIREFYDRFVEYYCFSIFKKNYFCCHGGLNFIPERIKLTSTRTLAVGDGSYETEVDDIYAKNYEKGMCRDFVQIHGHRRTASNKFSYCLEGGVENGGDLVYLGVKPNKVYVNTIRNKLFMENKGYKVEAEQLNKIINTSGIYIKELQDNILSVNFSRAVFESGAWNDMTTKARGLFIDKHSGQVVARSYDKFFNMGEMPETEPENLAKSLTFPVKLREKSDGFLGIVTMFNGNVKFFTKTTDCGEHIPLFKECWGLLKERTKHDLINIMVKHNCSIVFEVLHHKDPHIVPYKKDCLYLLDFVENNINTNYLDIEYKSNDANLIEPKVLGVANDFNELMAMLNKISKVLKFEGVVCRDAKDFMFKFKTDWFNTWKKRRRILDAVKIGKELEVTDAPNSEVDYYEWLQSNEDLKTKSLFEIMDLYGKLNRE